MARPLTDPLDRTIWTPRLDARLRKYWAAGLSKRDIGSLLGVTREAVKGRLRFLRVKRREPWRSWTDADTLELIRRLEADETIPWIASALKRTSASVKHRIRVLRDAGLLPTAPKRRAHFPIDWKIQIWQ